MERVSILSQNENQSNIGRLLHEILTIWRIFVAVKVINLIGKTAIITGAAKCIGKAIAIQLADCGVNITLVSRI